tara:strand:+ start:82 stop:321 length:240 start_codon:yes stop_codon:yes gene_type:complete
METKNLLRPRGISIPKDLSKKRQLKRHKIAIASAYTMTFFLPKVSAKYPPKREPGMGIREIKVKAKPVSEFVIPKTVVR